MSDIRRYCAGTQLLALHVPADFSADGLTFFTPSNLSQQLAHMSHPGGHTIEAHNHVLNAKEIFYTSEALFVRRGSARVDLYDNENLYIESFVIRAGDVLLLISGGHGFEMLEDCDMIEVKQGPYAGDCDKNRFQSVDRKMINITDQM